MDPQQISTILLGVVLSVPGLVAALGTRGRTDRKKLRRQLTDLEEAEAWILASRRGRRLHNDAEHADGRGAIDVHDLPSFILRGDEDD